MKKLLLTLILSLSTIARPGPDEGPLLDESLRTSDPRAVILLNKGYKCPTDFVSTAHIAEAVVVWGNKERSHAEQIFRLHIEATTSDPYACFKQSIVYPACIIWDHRMVCLIEDGLKRRRARKTKLNNFLTPYMLNDLASIVVGYLDNTDQTTMVPYELPAPVLPPAPRLRFDVGPLELATIKRAAIGIKQYMKDRFTHDLAYMKLRDNVDKLEEQQAADK